jgi:arginyl-tRNA synthetase
MFAMFGRNILRPRGESSYNADLPNVVADLDKAGLLATSEGAKGVFLKEFTNKENEPAFVIVQKTDGGYLYATTDLAAIRFRVQTLGANRILYVTDSRQTQHFAQIFAIARKAGFAERHGHPAHADDRDSYMGETLTPQNINMGGTPMPQVSLEHVPFGMMLGTDGRPFKTREGTAVKLMDLLDEAEKRAADLVRQKNPDLDDAGVKEIARVVGIGALKYADLSQNRASDYVFSWDKMLSLEGNTAPYMQYAYARIRSIFRKQEEKSPARQGGVDLPRGTAPEPEPESRAGRPCHVSIAEPAERSLAVKLLQFPETVQSVAEACLPNVLCAYLYDLAGAFMGFYENCPVLKADEPTRSSRLALCDLTARVIRKGLELLGIETLEKM